MPVAATTLLQPSTIESRPLSVNAPGERECALPVSSLAPDPDGLNTHKELLPTHPEGVTRNDTSGIEGVGALDELCANPERAIFRGETSPGSGTSLGPLAPPEKNSPTPPHRFRTNPELQRSIESRRFKGKWADVRGVAEENDGITAAEGFALCPPNRNPDASTESATPWQAVPPAPPAVLIRPSAESAPAPRRFDETEVCVVNCDTLTSALMLGDACVLNFANALTPGGRYRSGGRAQEEDLCRLLPQLYPSLVQAASSGAAAYPLPPDAVLLSRDLLAVRRPGSYRRCESMGEVTVISAAMPCGAADRRPRGGWAGSAWAADVTLRIRAVLHAAAHAGHRNLVLGAFGCGAFGNPAGPVAAIFREQLQSPEFEGRFAKVVFAVLDPLGTGNLGPFRRELRSIGDAGALDVRAK